MITTYTTYDEIRAILGVSENEIPDTVVGLRLYSNVVDVDLASISGPLAPDTDDMTLEEHYSYITGLETELTTVQRLFKLNLETYVAYKVADQLADPLSMSAPKTQSDGKSTLTRFSSEATFQSVRQTIKSVLDTVRTNLYVSLGLSSGEQTEYIQVVVPETDPVTG